MNAFRFRPIDTWFFKEARPMDGFGGTELGSLFPPPVRTLLGALRTAIGDVQDVAWDDYPQDYPKLAKRIGDHQSYGTLRCTGVFLEKDGKKLYPLPLHIVHLEDKGYAKMPIGEAIACDLGYVRLPRLPLAEDGVSRYKTFDKTAWIDHDDLLFILQGGTPRQVIIEDDLIFRESRVGIGRDVTTQTVQEGMLYMTSHIRLSDGVTVLLQIEGADDLIDTGLCRLGGEGRGASFEYTESDEITRPQKPDEPIEGIFFTLLTPGLIDPIKPLGDTVTSACVDRSLREGSFDMKTHSSREARSYVPAGSTWFMAMSESDSKTFIETHHDTQIGDEVVLGRGHIVCGYWTRQQSEEER